MKTAILIISYLKDRPYLELNLQSIVKFGKGFSSVNVLVPEEERDSFKDLTSRYPITLLYYYRACPESHWHLKHQLEKCRADIWCPDDDFVLHTDSDCMFTDPVTPEDYFVDGKPVMLYEHYERLKGTPWQSIVEDILKHPVAFEFMRRHPQVNPVGVYRDMRDFVVAVNNAENFDAYVLSRRPNFPWGFSEHNVIGAYAFYNRVWHDRYAWHNVAVTAPPKEKLIQFWSHAPIDVAQEISHGGKYKPVEFAERILK